jgi:hypothetical protein
MGRRLQKQNTKQSQFSPKPMRINAEVAWLLAFATKVKSKASIRKIIYPTDIRRFSVPQTFRGGHPLKYV